ncbi:hypothetical protein VNO80_05321 [Phaseolus coccineus]|uniref:Uncharacterized protein n=1 Tax=Phaseolus coccineus TaxID=3886 RepID=A0AAN9NEW0_PHACN
MGHVSDQIVSEVQFDLSGFVLYPFQFSPEKNLITLCKCFPYGIGGHVFLPSTLLICKQSNSIVDATNELLQQGYNFFHPLLPHLSSSLTWSPSTRHNCSTTMLKSNQF